MRADLLYFAYGSNLFSPRMRQEDRAPSAVAVTTATLPNHQLRFHKRGTDGSGKCSVVPDASRLVHGVVYRVPAAEMEALDRVEGVGRGYTSVELAVEIRPGNRLAVVTYVAESAFIADDLLPYDWYRDLVLAGAEEHRLPSAYLLDLRRVAARRDPHAPRETRERRHLPSPPILSR